MSVPQRSFLLRHNVMATIRNIDVRGVRRLAAWLPNVLLPKPERMSKMELKTIHGVSLLIDPVMDNGVELALYLHGTYEEGTVSEIQKRLQPGQTFLDIGANIGWISLIASKQVGLNGKVIAVEANPKTLPILQHNLALNQVENCSILGLALSDEVGETKIYENWNVNRGGASLLQQDDTEGIPIQMERLDNLYDPETPLHMVKIDVEGFEGKVIKGAWNWFKKQQPIIIFEISNDRQQNKGISGMDVMNLIKELGDYSFFKHQKTKERRGKLIQIMNENDLPNHDNLFAFPKM